jgi:hypothetical protein
MEILVEFREFRIVLNISFTDSVTDVISKEIKKYDSGACLADYVLQKWLSVGTAISMSMIHTLFAMEKDCS